jgi:cadmium resistance protein CadD (predicted permease)
LLHRVDDLVFLCFGLFSREGSAVHDVSLAVGGANLRLVLPEFLAIDYFSLKIALRLCAVRGDVFVVILPKSVESRPLNEVNS